MPSKLAALFLFFAGFGCGASLPPPQIVPPADPELHGARIRLEDPNPRNVGPGGSAFENAGQFIAALRTPLERNLRDAGFIIDAGAPVTFRVTGLDRHLASVNVEARGKSVAKLAVTSAIGCYSDAWGIGDAPRESIACYAAELVNQFVSSPAALAAFKAPAPAPGPAPEQALAAQPVKRGGSGEVIAVFDVEGGNAHVAEEVTNQLTDYLATRMAEVMRYRVLPREQIRERLTENKASSYKACIDQSCQIELGKSLAAQKSLSTKLLKIGKVCAMTSTLYDLKTETAESAASAKTDCDPSSLVEGVDKIVEQLNAKQ